MEALAYVVVLEGIHLKDALPEGSSMSNIKKVYLLVSNYNLFITFYLLVQDSYSFSPTILWNKLFKNIFLI